MLYVMILNTPEPRSGLAAPGGGTRAGRDLSSVLARVPVAPTLASRMHEEIEAAIIDGALEPGQRLHADDLARHYGVSRIPVREAFSSLDQAGWVEIRPRYGVHVRSRDRTELRELFEFRADVEGSVARWAAERRTESDLTALEQSVRKSLQMRADAPADQILTATNAFRDGLRRAAHNSVAASASATLEKRARFYFSTVVTQLGSEWLHVHERTLELIRIQDAETAASVAAQHIMATGRAVHALLFDENEPG